MMMELRFMDSGCGLVISFYIICSLSCSVDLGQQDKHPQLNLQTIYVIHPAYSKLSTSTSSMVLTGKLTALNELNVMFMQVLCTMVLESTHVSLGSLLRWLSRLCVSLNHRYTSSLFGQQLLPRHKTCEKCCGPTL